jgi:uncharacterized damage-inducible protein DinB
MNDNISALARLRDELTSWEELLAERDEAQIVAPIPSSGGSLKDVIAHLHAWQQVSLARMEAAANNTQPNMPDWLDGQDPESEAYREQFNARIHDIYRAQPWSQVHHAWRTGFRRFIALAEATPTESLMALDRFSWLRGYALVAVLEGSCEHHREHREQLDALDSFWKDALWQQFGAAIDMLEDAIRACPDDHWQDEMWRFEPQLSQFWYIAYHVLFWLDFYLSGSEDGFQPPAPFTMSEFDPAGALPPSVYAKDEILAYLHYGREKCRATIAGLTNARAREVLRFGKREQSYAELLLYNMRHVQEHGAQLSLYLGQIAERDGRWVGKARS